MPGPGQGGVVAVEEIDAIEPIGEPDRLHAVARGGAVDRGRCAHGLQLRSLVAVEHVVASRDQVVAIEIVLLARQRIGGVGGEAVGYHLIVAVTITDGLPDRRLRRAECEVHGADAGAQQVTDLNRVAAGLGVDLRVLDLVKQDDRGQVDGQPGDGTGRLPSEAQRVRQVIDRNVEEIAAFLAAIAARQGWRARARAVVDPGDAVVSRAAVGRSGAAAGIDDVVAGVAGDRIDAGPAGDVVEAVPAKDEVVAGPAVDDVAAEVAGLEIGVGQRDEGRPDGSADHRPALVVVEIERLAVGLVDAGNLRLAVFVDKERQIPAAGDTRSGGRGIGLELVTAVDVVDAAVAGDDVETRIAVDDVAALAAENDVVTGAAAQRDAAVELVLALDLEAVLVGATADCVGPRAKQAGIDVDDVEPGSAIKVEHTEEKVGPVGIGKHLDDVVPGPGVDPHLVNDAVQLAQLEGIGVGAAGPAQYPDLAIEEEFGGLAGADDQRVLALFVQTVVGNLVAHRQLIGTRVIADVDEAVLGQVGEREVVVDQHSRDVVVLRSGETAVAQRQRVAGQLCDVGIDVVHALVVEGGNEFVDEALGLLEQGDGADAEVEADPQEGLEEEPQLAVHVEQARRVEDVLEQFFAVEFAVADRQVVEELGLEIVEVEVDRRGDAALDPGLDETADAEAGEGADRRLQADLGLVFRRALAAMIVKEEALEDAPAFGRVVIGSHPLADAARVEAEVEVGRRPDLAEQADVESGKDRIRVLVLEQQVEVGKVVGKERRIAPPEQEIEDRQWIFEQRNAEATGAADPLLLDCSVVVRQPFLIRAGRGFSELGLLRGGPGAAGIRRLGAADIAIGRLGVRILERIFGDVEVAKIERSRVGQTLRLLDELDRRLDDLEYLLGRVDGRRRQPQIGKIDELELGDADVEFHQQQIDHRLERRDDVVDRVERRPEIGVEDAADIERDGLERDVRRPDRETGAARSR